MDQKSHFASIVAENEQAVQIALNGGDYLQAFLLIHTLIESLLRTFLAKDQDYVRFKELIDRYEGFLKSQNYPEMTFVKELTEFNSRRNRVVHQLWKKGYISTNAEIKDAAMDALTVYTLFIEFLETFDDQLRDSGFFINE